MDTEFLQHGSRAVGLQLPECTVSENSSYDTFSKW